VNGFVTRSGSQLQLNGNTFRFSGANIYWEIADENVNNGAYTTQFRVDDAFTTAQEMGATVVRAPAASFGCSQCIEPSLGSFNEFALQQLDYAVKSAGDHGIRLIVDFVDNYHTAGGKHFFTDWRGLSNEDDFYTNTTVIGDFEQYISTILNRVNTYTGATYKDDPTILAWEEGNELSDAPASWVSTIADYIKSVDSNHLVSFSASNSGGPDTVQQDTLSVPNLDIEDAHFYPMNVSELNNFASLTENAGKVFYAGEYDWNNYPISWKGNQTGDSLSSFLSALETDGAAGDTYWSLFPHNDTYGYVQHGDGFTLHYPGDTSDMQSRDQALRTHAYTMSGRSVPADGTPATPVVTGVRGQAIAWRGSTPSATYSVERSTSGSNGPWALICNQCATDNNTPWTDSSQPGGTLWYRVQGYNRSGVAGNYSSAYYYDPSNLVQNPGFETGDVTDWLTWYGSDGSGAGTAYTQANGQAHSGLYHGVEWKASPYEVSLYQCIANVPNGTYVASAWVQSSGGQDAAIFSVDGGNHDTLASANIPTSSSWQLLSLPPVNVTTGTACLTFYSHDKGHDWITFDDVSLTAQ
jgi:hypothetical protein